MKIVVAYKWAAKPQDAIVAANGTVDWSRAAAAVSEYDPVAIELGRQLADASGGELIGVSVGGPELASPMAKKAALSRGLDRAVIVADDALSGASTTETALALAALVTRIGGVDLVLTGDSSVDTGARMVPAVLAGALGWPVVLQASSVAGTPGELRVERAHEGGSQLLAVRGPAVVSVAADAMVARVPGMKDILAAGKRPTEQVALGELAGQGLDSAVGVVGRARPSLKARKAQMIDASDATAAAATLVAALRSDAVI